MNGREFRKLLPGANLLLVGGQRFSVNRTADYQTLTDDKWRNVMDDIKDGTKVLEVMGGQAKARYWVQVLDLLDVVIGAREIDYGERHFRIAEAGTEATMSIKMANGDVLEKASVTYVYADVKDKKRLLCVERQGESEIFVWYSDHTISLKEVEVI